MRINKRWLSTLQSLIKLIVACAQEPDSSLTSLPLHQQSLLYMPKANIKISPKEKQSITDRQHSSGFDTTRLGFAPHGYASTVMDAEHSLGPYFLWNCFSQEAKFCFFIQARLVKFAFVNQLPIALWFHCLVWGWVCFFLLKERLLTMCHISITLTNSPTQHCGCWVATTSCEPRPDS